MIVLDASAILAVAHKDSSATRSRHRYFSRLGAWVTAELWRKGHGLSLGDRACLALTRETGGIAYTTDRAWKTIGEEFDIPVRLLR